MAPAIEAVMALSSLRAGTGNASRFPRPCATVPRRPAGPGQTEASARPGGREAPAGGGAGAGRGLWPPAGPDPGAALWQGRWPLPMKRRWCCHMFGRKQETRPAFPRPCGTVPCRPAVPGQTEASARPGGGEAPAGGGAGAGRGLWPPAGPDPAAALWQGRWPLPLKRCQCLRPSGRGNATRVSPARTGRCPVDPNVREKQRPAPDPAGDKRPPGAGRALAGGFGPPAGQGSARRWAKGDAPAMVAGSVLSPLRWPRLQRPAEG